MRSESSQAGGVGLLDLVRRLFALALVVATVGHVSTAVRSFDDAAPSGSAALALVVVVAPAVVYVTAVALTFVRRPLPSFWVALLACGIAFSAVTLDRAGSAGVYGFSAAPLCLVALALLQLLGGRQPAVDAP